jgi:kynurenine formamidase
MPLFAGHPAFQVLSYRTPHGLRVAKEETWPGGNDVGLGYLSELLLCTTHSGAHVDALAHMTLGEDDHWLGGSAQKDVGDFGPVKDDAAELPPIWTRGVLFDVPGHRGIACLRKGEPIGAGELEAVARTQGIDLEPGDVALIRTGYLGHWPDPERLAAHRGAGPDLSAARWLAERGVLATGSDTETFEVQPAPPHPGPRNPQPVHTFLLIERGIYILESLDLEQLARDSVYEFLFVALPLKIKGATGSMVDPVAVV